ncbi:MAG: dicarboxylate/amino acid:cation symporter [Candidatus Sumerlaeia bacterium]|nr:dicarboxylate/amino acid:cation symporter [Candidatus Sumerlaeia bacterium]
MKFFTERNLTFALIGSIVLGVGIGAIAQATEAAPLVRFIESIQIFGKLFLRTLTMIVVPLVLFSVITGMANLHGTGEVRRKVFKVLGFFLLTSFFAVLIGIFYTNIIQPGAGTDAEELRASLPETSLQAAGETQESIALRAPESVIDFIDMQIDNIFQNPFKSMAETNLIGVVFFGLFLGFMLMLCGSQARSAIDFFNAINEALMKMVTVIIWLAPPGILALASNLAMTMGPEIVGPMGKYFATVCLALLTHILIVYPLILKFMCGYSPIKFFKGIYEAQILAITTSSSAATMPVTLRVVEEHLGVDKRSADLVVPMGATINMDGTALYEAIAAMFIAQLLGYELGLMQQILVFFTATLAAIGAAGVPQAGLVTMVVVFNALGLPLEWMALIIVVDRPLDHLRTVVNITGDATGAVYLSTSEGDMNPEISSAAEI